MATVAITPDQDVVTAEIFIAAPPARVFAAITDPYQMPKWWGQQGMYKITEWKGDLRPGGKWSSVGVSVDGSSFRVGGEYLEVDPPRTLSIPGSRAGAVRSKPSSDGSLRRKASMAYIPAVRRSRAWARW
jgi:uncharacterized protein YndB with AHSA1/START domain